MTDRAGQFHTRRNLLRAAALGGLGAAGLAFLTACGAREPQAGALANSNQQAFGKDDGGKIDTLRLTMPGSLSNLYPGQESGVLNYVMAAAAIEGLMTVNDKGVLKPGLASKLTRPNAHTYVYTLDPRATFSTGAKVTTEDVLASVAAARNAKLSPSTASYWAAVKDVKATGTGEITFTLKYDDVTFGWVPTVVDALWVMPADFWNQKSIGGPETLIVGSGPYRVTEFVPSSHLTFQRNPHWRGTAGRPATIRVDFIEDDTTRLLSWQSGQADISLNVPLSQAAQWAASPHTTLRFQPDRSYAGLTFNTAAKPFNDIHVRRAVAHAIDKKSLVSDVLLGQAQVATALTTPEQLGQVWSPAQATRKLAGGPDYAFDLKAAKEELAKSATPNGFSVDLSYPNTGPQLGTAALAFAETLGQIGIKVKVKQLAIEQWLAELGKFPPLSFMWYFNTTGDPGELPTWFLSAGNPAKYANKSVDGLVGQAAAVTDPVKRADLLVRAQHESAADLPYLPLWWGRSATAFADSVGVTDYSSYTFNSTWPQSVYPTNQGA